MGQSRLLMYFMEYFSADANYTVQIINRLISLEWLKGNMRHRTDIFANLIAFSLWLESMITDKGFHTILFENKISISFAHIMQANFHYYLKNKNLLIYIQQSLHI